MTFGCVAKASDEQKAISRISEKDLMKEVYGTARVSFLDLGTTHREGLVVVLGKRPPSSELLTKFGE